MTTEPPPLWAQACGYGHTSLVWRPTKDGHYCAVCQQFIGEAYDKRETRLPRPAVEIEAKRNDIE